MVLEFHKGTSRLFAIYLPLGLLKGRPCLQPLKKNIQHFKSWNFFPFFYFLGVIFALLDPDPVLQNQCGSMRSRIPNTGYRHIFILPPMRVHADPDPKHCWKPQRNCTFMNSASGEMEDWPRDNGMSRPDTRPPAESRARREQNRSHMSTALACKAELVNYFI